MSWPDGFAEALTSTTARSFGGVRPPGFINMRLETAAQAKVALSTLGHYGHCCCWPGAITGIRLRQPTDRSTRRYLLGDALGPFAHHQGADVVREYYSTTTAPRSTDSPTLALRPRANPSPQDGYAGSYIAIIAEQVLQRRAWTR